MGNFGGFLEILGSLETGDFLGYFRGDFWGILGEILGFFWGPPDPPDPP